MFTSRELEELIDEMDAHGVERAVLTANFAEPVDRAFRSSTSAPDRFALALGGHDLLRPDGEPAALEASWQTTGRLHRRRPELLGRRDVSAERRRLLPALHEVLRARAAAVHQHRASRPAASRRGAEPHPPRPCLRSLPRAQVVHDARRRPVVGHRHPADDQVRQPAPDDVGVVARISRSLLHFMRRGGKNKVHVRLGLTGALDHAMYHRAAALDLPPEVLDAYLYRNAQDVLLRQQTPARDWSTIESDVTGRARDATPAAHRPGHIDNPDAANAYDPPMRRRCGELPRRARGRRRHQGRDPARCGRRVHHRRGHERTRTAGTGRGETSADRANAAVSASTARPSASTTATEFPKVTVAQVETYALGGGFELALMSDIAVVGRDARLGMPGARLLGPALGNLHLFFYRLGPVLARACCSPATSSTPAARASRHLHRRLRARRGGRARRALGGKVARMPADGLAIAKTGFTLIEQTTLRRGAGDRLFDPRVRYQPAVRGRRVQLRQGPRRRSAPAKPSGSVTSTSIPTSHSRKRGRRRGVPGGDRHRRGVRLRPRDRASLRP